MIKLITDKDCPKLDKIALQFEEELMKEITEMRSLYDSFHDCYKTDTVDMEEVKKRYTAMNEQYKLILPIIDMLIHHGSIAKKNKKIQEDLYKSIDSFNKKK